MIADPARANLLAGDFPFASDARFRSRSGIARERAGIAHASLVHCELCAIECGADRLGGEVGPCHAGAEARVFSAQLESGDELELIPTFAIALSGCDFRCDFCITGAESWNARAGRLLDPEALGERARAALARGARTVMILGGEPTVHLPAALEIVAALPDDARLIWKTNAHGSPHARGWLDGLFDVWLADYKFGNDDCARRLAKVVDYTRIVRENLLWAAGHSELIVRHLLMPGHAECCWRPIAEWLAAELPDVKISLQQGFWPAWYSGRHAELSHPASVAERERALQLGRRLNLNLIP